MSNSQFDSLNKTIVGSGDYITKKRQQAIYRTAHQKSSGFGVATDYAGNNVVVTAKNYEDLLSLTKGRYHSIEQPDAATLLQHDIWAGNKTQIKTGDILPVEHDGHFPTLPNTIPYVSTIEGTGYSGFHVDPEGELFGKGELGRGPDWMNAVASLDPTNTPDYQRGVRSQPFYNFSYPGRVPLYAL